MTEPAADPFADWRAIAREAWDHPGWETVAKEWRNAPIPRPEPPRRREAAQSTYDAVLYVLREQGLGALDHPHNRARLAELSRAQLLDLIGRLTRIRQKHPATINADLLEALAKRLHNVDRR